MQRRRRTTSGEDSLDDVSRLELDDTDASVIHGISVNDMQDSQRALRDADRSDWAQRLERERMDLNDMRRNLPPKGQARARTAARLQRYHLKWRPPEVKRLLRLWFQHGNSWARIKTIDDQSSEPQLKDRTQVDLKDKVRTIKAWMLR